MKDIPIKNIPRDKAWAKFIKRKDIKAFMQDKHKFAFPLDGSYEVWIDAWEQAWQEGFESGYTTAQEVGEKSALP